MLDKQRPLLVSKIVNFYSRLSAVILSGLVAVLAAVLISSAVIANPLDNSDESQLYLPVTMAGFFDGSSLDGISGKVLVKGQAVGNIALDLRHYDGENWSIVDSVETNDLGYYQFEDADSLAPGEEYYVSYGQNETDPGHVYFWYGPILEEYSKGDKAFGGSFDIADVPLVSPDSGAEAALPVTLSWEKRDLPGETYRLVIIDFDEDVYWRTFDLGNVSSYTLNSLAPGMKFNRQYAWYVEVYMGPDNFGESFMVNDIKFKRNNIQQTDDLNSNDAFSRGYERGGR